MAKTSMTREEAIAYLSSRGLLTKAPESYSTPYVKRLASAYSRAEQKGRSTSRTVARGKAGPEHIVPNYARGPLPEGVPRDRFSEQYKIVFPETVSDLKPLKLSVDRRRKAKGLPKAKIYTLVIYGKTRYKHPKNPSGSYTYQTLAMHISALDLAYYIKEQPDMDIVEFINLFWQPLRTEDEWERIETIAMKVGN